MSKRVSKYIASFDYFDKLLIAFSVVTGNIFVASIATGAPAGIASASLVLDFQF